MKNFEIKNVSPGESEIYIFGEIYNYDKNSAEEFKRQLDTIPQENKIKLCVNSPGGDVFQAMAIYNLIKPISDRVSCEIVGIALSSAAWLGLSSEKVVMRKQSLMMIHNPTSGAYGDEDEMKKSLNRLDKVKNLIVGILVEKSGKSEEEIIKMMSEETWFTAQEALEAGFVDGISEEEIEIENLNFENVKAPLKILNEIKSSIMHDTAQHCTFQNEQSQVKNKKDIMKDLIEILNKNGFEIKENAVELDFCNGVNSLIANNAEIVAQRDKEIAELETQKSEALAQVENLQIELAQNKVQVFVDNKKIDESQKDFFVQNILKDEEATLKVLNGLKTPQVGGNPLNVNNDLIQESEQSNLEITNKEKIWNDYQSIEDPIERRKFWIENKKHILA